MVRLIRLAALSSAALLFASHARAQRSDTLALSIQDAVALALRTGDEARTAAALVDVADAQVTVARASALPQIRINSSYTHIYENARAQAVGQIFNQPNTYSSNANISQPLFQGGREWAALRVASRTRAAARLSADETRARLSVDVQSAYFQALFTDRLVEIRAAGYALAEGRVRQIEQFQNAGRAARYDVLRARVERANLEPSVIQARDDRELALLELKRLVNIPAGQPVALTTSLNSGAVVAMLASLSSDSTANGDDRPSVRAAELLLQARRSGVSIARAERLPTFSIFFQTGFQAFPLSGFPTTRGEATTIPCPTDSPQTSCRPTSRQNGGWFQDRLIGAQLSWPLFDGFRAKGNIDLAKAQARLAEVQLHEEREAVATEVARARAGVARAKALFAAQRETSTEADEAFRLASLRFTRGLGTQLETSDAQLALLTSQTNEARSVFDLYLASAELARALGRSIPLPPQTPPARITSSPGTGVQKN
ncbi:MAG: TolC family protein [Gemmatimonadota bacterium]|nr:TolC family protein [Gemmatimonadota bacterium]